MVLSENLVGERQHRFVEASGFDRGNLAADHTVLHIVQAQESRARISRHIHFSTSVVLARLRYIRPPAPGDGRMLLNFDRAQPVGSQRAFEQRAQAANAVAAHGAQRQAEGRRVQFN